MAARATPTKCSTCHSATARHGLPLCLGCYVAEQRAAGYADGFCRGLAEGEVRTWSRLAESGRLRPDPMAQRPDVSQGCALVVTREHWRRISSLIHPDRHGGTVASTTASALWNSIRDRVRP